MNWLHIAYNSYSVVTIHNANSVCELSALIVTNIPWLSAQQSRDNVLFHILAHVNLIHGDLHIEHELRHCLGVANMLSWVFGNCVEGWWYHYRFIGAFLLSLNTQWHLDKKICPDGWSIQLYPPRQHIFGVHHQNTFQLRESMHCWNPLFLGFTLYPL
jgi:hypothetical protein